jgi:nucleoid-associated protein YgaU
MFTDKSRYAKVATVETQASGGRSVVALKLRRLPPEAGDPYTVKDNDRLDLLAQQQYGDGTGFWHIADANSALQANDLTAVTGESLNLPKT